MDQRLAGHQRRLGAAVDEAPTPASAQAGERVAGALDVAALEVLPRPPLAEVGGEVEGGGAAGGAGGERGAVAEVAAHRLGAEALDLGGRGVGAGQRPHRPAFGDQALDQPRRR